MTRPVDELLAAVRGRDRAAAVAALDRDPSLVTARTASGETPVLLAIYHRAPDVLTLLRARGATLDVFEAAAAGDVDRVRALLDTDPTLVNAHAPDGWTPLHLAGHFRHTAMVDVLLARGADMNATSRNGHANAPLHAAAAGRAGAALMRRLLDAGARVNARQSGGHTPLHEAALGGDAEVVRLLLAAGADPETGNHEGQTPADVARQAGHAAIAEAIDAGARGRMR